MSSEKFNPDRFKCYKPPLEAFDPGLQTHLVQVSLPTMKRERYIPAFPLSFLQHAAPAGDALPILLIAFATMRIKNEKEISLGPSVWSMIGNPGPRVRSRLLRQISGLPVSLCIIESRVGRPHLLRAGPDWPVKITNQQ